MPVKKEFWDLDEMGRQIMASDGITYTVKDTGTDIDIQAAEILASVRRDINKLLIYLCENPQLWSSHPMAFGIYHTFDIHIPCWESMLSKSVPDKLQYINDQCIKMGKLFVYQETPTNRYGILGLNKPKEITTIKVDLGDKVIDYDLGKRRLIMLTLRTDGGKLCTYNKIMYLAIHELTHTVCNDVRWIPESQGGNHRPPYENYHTMMKKWAKNIGILE
jgi:hypothetical protein